MGDEQYLESVLKAKGYNSSNHYKQMLDQVEQKLGGEGKNYSETYKHICQNGSLSLAKFL